MYNRIKQLGIEFFKRNQACLKILNKWSNILYTVTIFSVFISSKLYIQVQDQLALLRMLISLRNAKFNVNK